MRMGEKHILCTKRTLSKAYAVLNYELGTLTELLAITGLS